MNKHLAEQYKFMNCLGCQSFFSQHDLIEGFCHQCTAKQRDAFRDAYEYELRDLFRPHEIEDAIKQVLQEVRYGKY